MSEVHAQFNSQLKRSSPVLLNPVLATGGDNMRERGSASLAVLIARVAGGDRAAFRTLYDATSAHLLGVAFSLLQNKARAEEVLQEAYVSVWQKAASYDPNLAQPMTWLINIVRNRAIDLLRAQRNEASLTVPLDDETAATVASFEPLPEYQLQRALDAARLERGLHGLTREQRQALALVIYRGMTYAEVAAAAGVPLPTAKSWVRRGLARLKECIGAETAQ
jgi:RNA polymerase sigma-70 factor (ECF subfamily)